MKLSELKDHLSHLEHLTFRLPTGELVPAHAHVSEISLLQKHSIDCGRNVRVEQAASFQLWVADDVDHRLDPSKFTGIIEHSERVLQLPDAELEVEYQGDTIGKYHLEAGDGYLQLVTTHTSCRASESCGVTPKKKKIRLSDVTSTPLADFVPGGGCC